MKPLDLSGSFLARVRAYPKETRGRIGLALQRLVRDFGHPHRHRGLGIRKLTGSFFEIRAGLDIRLVFQNRAECLLFVMAGNHAEVQKFLREGAEYVIKDLSSRNGTWVHGHRALTARLRHNDCILAGHTLFRFCEERAGVSPALQPVSGPHGTKILFPAASTGPDRTAADS